MCFHGTNCHWENHKYIRHIFIRYNEVYCIVSFNIVHNIVTSYSRRKYANIENMENMGLSIDVITILRRLNILCIHYLYPSKCWTIKEITSKPFHQIVWRIPRVILITKFILYRVVLFICLLTLIFSYFFARSLLPFQ